MYRLMIVDDERVVTDGLYELFTQERIFDLDVKKAYSGRAALDIAKEMRVDILLSDISMPVMDGIQLFKQVLGIWRHCKAIFLTGYNDFNLIQQIMRCGAVDYIVKTEGDKVLWAAIEKAVRILGDEGVEGLTVDDMYSTDGDDILENANKIITKINAYIAKTPLDEFSVLKMSNDLHYNPSYISRIYKQITGKNIVDLMGEVKIKEAKKLLRGNAKAQDIAKKLGFESASYFTRFFKKHVGLSPQKYKETHRDS